MDQTQLISNVVREVIGRLGPNLGSGNGQSSVVTGDNSNSNWGVHADVDQAVETATRAQQQLEQSTMEVRDGICKLLKSMAMQNAKEWGRIELEETKIGRLDHKIGKLELLANVPGVEFLRTVAHSGDDGIALDEAAPFGVIGAITPITHSIPTLTCNAINMIASGNALVANPHPGGAKCAAMATAAFNQAIKARFGIDPLINVINPPTLESAEQIFKHERIPLLVVTGGPMVARAAMKQPKRAIVAGPGNPPVVVDETADLDNAAQSIIAGAAFDNNLLCIGEKEVFVVDSVFDAMMSAMERAGAARLNAQQIQRLTEAAFKWDKDHYVLSKDLLGKDPQVLAQAAGANIGSSVELLFGETDESNPFVPEEQMMPFVPFVRVRDFDQALALAVKHEHGFGHTVCIHSNHLARITQFAKACNTTLVAVNGPSTGCLGAAGEGYASFSIATPTGEGVTTPLTFTRFRRVSVCGSMRII
jgi:aldehyde dehydrogenase